MRTLTKSRWLAGLPPILAYLYILYHPLAGIYCRRHLSTVASVAGIWHDDWIELPVAYSVQAITNLGTQLEVDLELEFNRL